MENYPGSFENPFSTPEVDKKKDDTEKSKEKKKSQQSSPEKRRDDAKKIAESLDKSSIFKAEKRPEAEAGKKPELKHLKEPEAADEAKAPLEKVGENEAREVARELAAARREEVAAESETEAEGDWVAEEAAAGIEAAEVFLQKVEATGDMDQAYQEVAQEFDLPVKRQQEPAEEGTPETEQAIAEEAPVAIEEIEPGSEPDEPIELEEGEIPLGVSEAANTDEDDNPILAGAGAGSSGSGGDAGTGGHGEDGGTVPPPENFDPQAASSGSAVPLAARFNMAPPSTETLYTEAEVLHAQSRGLLVGGILGYLIGRRRGRIKTEKRLFPIQQRLEKQVKTIQEQLYDREFEVRQLVAQKAAAKRPERAEPVTAAGARMEPARLTGESLARGVIPPERTRTARRETRLGLAKPARAEKLGRVIVQAEAGVSAAPEIRKIKPEQVKAMSRQEVVQLSEKVVVESVTLREMYEDHLLSERGLRRVVSEYLQGNDIQSALKQELVERQIDFERDPMLRDKAYHEFQQDRGGTSSLQQLLQQAGVNTDGDDQLSSVVKQLQAAHQESIQQESHRRKVVDTAMITFIVILSALVAYLLFSR